MERFNNMAADKHKKSAPFKMGRIQIDILRYYMTLLSLD